MSASGFIKWEPLDDKIPFEEPELLKKATELLLKNSVKAPSELLADLRLSASTVSRACQLTEETFAAPESAPIVLELELKQRPERANDFETFSDDQKMN